jgi:hypothetical protein
VTGVNAEDEVVNEVLGLLDAAILALILGCIEPVGVKAHAQEEDGVRCRANDGARAA